MTDFQIGEPNLLRPNCLPSPFLLGNSECVIASRPHSRKALGGDVRRSSPKKAALAGGRKGFGYRICKVREMFDAERDSLARALFAIICFEPLADIDKPGVLVDLD